MKKNIFLACLLLLTIVSINAQSSLDSLRLVLPTFHQIQLGSNMWDPIDIVVSKDNRFLLSLEIMNKEGILWDLNSSKIIKKYKNIDEAHFISENLLAIQNEDSSKIYIYNFFTDSLIFSKPCNRNEFLFTKDYIVFVKNTDIQIFNIKDLKTESTYLQIDSVNIACYEYSMYYEISKLTSFNENLILLVQKSDLLVYDLKNNAIKSKINCPNINLKNIEAFFYGNNSNKVCIKTDNKISIYDLFEQKFIKTFHMRNGESLILSNNDRYFTKNNESNKTEIFDFKDNKTISLQLEPEQIMIPHSGIFEVFITDIIFLPEKETIITLDFGEFGIKYWDLNNGKLLKKIETNFDIFGRTITLNDEKIITCGTYLQPILLWDLNSSKKLKNLFGNINCPLEITTDNDTKINLKFNENESNNVFTWDVNFAINNVSNILKKSNVDLPIRQFYSPGIDIDTTSLKRKILKTVKDQRIASEILYSLMFYDFEQRDKFLTSINSNQDIICLSFNDNDSIVLINLDEEKVFVVKKPLFEFDDIVLVKKDLILFEKRVFGDHSSSDGISSFLLLNFSGETIFKFEHKDAFKNIYFFDNQSIVVIEHFNGLIQIIDYKLNENLYDLYFLDNNNWLVKLPNSPYYMCSKDASKMLHYVTPSLKVIGFEQLDPVYNRPDIVLDSIGKYFGNEDRGMIEEYRKAWEKRIERLGLKDQIDKLGKGEISVPNAEIENADSIAYENSEGTVKLLVKANDPKYKLRRFNVWVNEVPIYGSNGISIAGLNKNNWDTTLSVPLSLGDNKIQVSVMNELGLENFKYPTYVNYKSEKVVPKTHFIGIAVDKFDNGMNLSFCVKDVKDLSGYFSKLPNCSIKLLTEKDVTKENISQLKEYLKTTSVQDRVIISCSSHGILDSTSNFFLATHDTDFDNPKLNGISYEMLDGLLDDIPARKKLLLLDACNSGENEEGFVKMDNSSMSGRGANKIEDEIVKESNFKKMKELFVNVRNNSGAYIISATGGIQKALEGEAVMLNGKPLENGSFTYAVLEYLKENESNKTKLTVNQLKKYVEQRVIELTNGKQTPTSRQETMEIDWDLH
jgi:hypothetical protein